MFIGSFYRVKTRAEVDTSMIIGSPTAIVFVEEEGKMYEKNSYGVVKEYNCEIKNSVVDTQMQPLDNSKELKEMEERLTAIESFVSNFSKVFKGGE